MWYAAISWISWLLVLVALEYAQYYVRRVKKQGKHTIIYS